jgi:hypothetical protein
VVLVGVVGGAQDALAGIPRGGAALPRRAPRGPRLGHAATHARSLG